MPDNKHNEIIRPESGALMKRPEPMAMVYSPMADVYETADAFVLKLDLPGATKETIYLAVEPDQLSVKAKVETHITGNTKFLYSEIGEKTYRREFNLGKGIDRDGITAQFNEGVLTIVLPKTDTIRAKEIQIQ